MIHCSAETRLTVRMHSSLKKARRGGEKKKLPKEAIQIRSKLAINPKLGLESDRFDTLSLIYGELLPKTIAMFTPSRPLQTNQSRSR